MLCVTVNKVRNSDWEVELFHLRWYSNNFMVWEYSLPLEKDKNKNEKLLFCWDRQRDMFEIGSFSFFRLIPKVYSTADLESEQIQWETR